MGLFSGLWPSNPVGDWWDRWGWVVYLIIVLLVLVAVAYVWRSFK